MATPTVQLNLRVLPGMIIVLDELAAEAGQSRTRYIAQLVKNAQIRRDIERDVEWYHGNEPTELAMQVARQGTRAPVGVHAPGKIDAEGTDVVADTGGHHPEPAVGAGRAT